MSIRPHGRAQTDPTRPAAYGVCDRCGFLYNLRDLSWQFDYAGIGLLNYRILVCEPCYDTPQQQKRPVILPADPLPVANVIGDPATDGMPVPVIVGDPFVNVTAARVPPPTYVAIGKLIVSLFARPCAVRPTSTTAKPEVVLNVGTAPPLLTVDVAFIDAVMV